MADKIPYRQDLPPAGGFEPLRFRRNIAPRGPSGAVIFGAIAAICGFGFYRLGQGHNEKRELKRETAWSRIHLVPFLLAENDRDVYRRSQAAVAREKAIMKDVEGWEAGKSVYNSPRYTPSTIVVI